MFLNVSYKYKIIQSWFCVYLVSFRGHAVPADSSLSATGPSAVRLRPECSAVNRVWAWTKAKPRD